MNIFSKNTLQYWLGSISCILALVMTQAASADVKPVQSLQFYTFVGEMAPYFPATKDNEQDFTELRVDQTEYATLSDLQQTALSNTKNFDIEKWNNHSVEKRQDILRGIRDWHLSKASKKRHLKREYPKWRRLDPISRAQTRERMRRYQSLSPEMRQSLRQRYRHYQELPAAER